MVRNYPTPLIFLDDIGPDRSRETLLAVYAEESEHPLWRELSERAEGFLHGGMDYVMNCRPIDGSRRGDPPEIDVYAVVDRSRTMEFPDLSWGRWTSQKPLAIVHVELALFERRELLG